MSYILRYLVTGQNVVENCSGVSTQYETLQRFTLMVLDKHSNDCLCGTGDSSGVLGILECLYSQHCLTDTSEN
jgi:hypothetical protein